MPAFMFEKISSPIQNRVQAIALPASGATESRGVIVQMLDKLTEARLQREAKAMRKARASKTFTEADIKPT